MESNQEQNHEYLLGQLFGFQLSIGILLRFLAPPQRTAFIQEAEKAIKKARSSLIRDRLPDRSSDGVVETLRLLIEEAEREEWELPP